MNAKELIVKQKVEDMIIWSKSPLKNFPRYEKYVMVAEIRQCMYRLLRLTIKANRQRNKKTTLLEVDVELDFLRSLVSEAHNQGRGYISRKQYAIWSEKLATIGNLVGGWIAWVYREQN